MDHIGAYEVIRSLHTGEYAEIFLCRDNDSRFAIKLFQINSPRLRHEAENREFDERLRHRFENEVRVLNELNSPNIIEIHDSGELADGAPYYVMPYLPMGLRDLIFERIDRQNVTAPLPRERPCSLPIDQIISILRQLLSALGVSHGHGIILRDVKPANIRIDSHNNLKLCDFGFAKGPWRGQRLNIDNSVKAHS